MTSALTRVRDLALLLPEAAERDEDGAPTFTVADTPFARLRGDGVEVRGDDGGWSTMSLADDADWALIEDRIAHSWELAAPRGLLEAGGR
ncbi:MULTISPECIES: hypothetical protein [unclassified Sphingomonas]|uniref:hypothetical protein n=1 Tax=unclassified Sphingomonas TaxID=196159 RepID=UPI00044657F1|nr:MULTISPECIES: hypothetical protein [unclassified Sphingomonas]EZP48836.1 hypothetical protein BW41_03836 [Sphingomonas sp. RIT328]